ncbi:unnamed protein product, partial [Medioppia subpectinata]
VGQISSGGQSSNSPIKCLIAKTYYGNKHLGFIGCAVYITRCVQLIGTPVYISDNIPVPYVSLLGNVLICKVILSGSVNRRRTTNVLIANLTISDLVMTVFTIPVTIARLILDDWPFGSWLCILAPFVQVTSVYVSTLSMIIIALDRYQVVVNPLTARLSARLPKYIMVIIIWVLAGVLSIPHAVFNRSVTSVYVSNCFTLAMIIIALDEYQVVRVRYLYRTFCSTDRYPCIPIGQYTGAVRYTRGTSYSTGNC